MDIRIIDSPVKISGIAPKIIKFMEQEGYTLVATTTRPSQTRSRNSICYLNFVSTSTQQNLNDKL